MDETRAGAAETGSTLAARLGFCAEDRIAILHADDIGMCHAANLGAFECLDRGAVTCGSLMVPCPWFAEAVEMAAARPGVDLGVHLTLNSEWPRYRWGPVSGADAVPSLVDAQGYLHRTPQDVLANARPDEVERELRAQVERALAAGIDVTHLDAHMGTALMPPFVDVYARLALDYRVPVFAVRPDATVLARFGTASGAAIARAVAALTQAGVPILDGIDSDSLRFPPGGGLEHNHRRLTRLGPGVHYLLCHPARGGEELEAIAADAHAREFERGFYGSEAGCRALEAHGIRTLGMRALRELMRAPAR